MSKIAIHKQVLEEAFGKEVENLRGQKLIPLALCSKPPRHGGPGMPAVRSAALRLGGPRFASKETLCEFLDNYAMKPIDPSLKAAAVVAAPVRQPAIAAQAPQPVAVGVAPIPVTAVVEPDSGGMVCTTGVAPQTLSQQLAAKMAKFKPSPALVEPSPKLALDNAVAPCGFGIVDRCCLKRETQCGPYVVSKVNVDKYGQNVKLLGEGTYGAVYKTDKGYAVKCMKRASKSAMLEDTDLREISILRNLLHPNIVTVEQIAVTNITKNCVVAVVMPLMSGTLKCIDLTKDEQLRAYVMYQFVRAVAYVHSRGVLHRDIKPINVLWHEPSMTVKLADFGLAQGLIEPFREYSENVGTSWYRAPEIFLGKTKYGAETDIWAVGASWLELVNWSMLQVGDFDEHLTRTFEMLGVPSTTLWPEALKLPHWPQWEAHAKALQRFTPYPIKIGLGKRHISMTEIDLVEQLLALDPGKRITANAALKHPFFDSVRPFVEEKIGAPSIPPNTLIGCGDVLLAMESAPVGDYVAKFYSDSDADCARGKKVFEIIANWVLQIKAKYNVPTSVVLLAQSLFHRFAAKETKLAFHHEVVKGYMVACLLIANKLDADGPRATSFEVEKALDICAQCVTPLQLAEMERKILTTLDMDIDRPTAATFLSYFLEGNANRDVKIKAKEILLDVSSSYDIGVNVSGSLQSLAALTMAGAAESACVRQLKAFLPQHTIEHVNKHIVPLFKKFIEEIRQ